MVFVFGTRIVKIFTEVTAKKCDKCIRNGNLTNEVYQKTFNLFLIPFFPVKKYCYIKCNMCNTNYFVDTDNYYNLKDKAKTPTTSFIGLIIVPLFCLTMFIFFKFDQYRENEYFENPKLNDIYYMTTGNKEFTILKVVNIESDSISLLQCGIVTDNEYSLNSLEKKKDEIFKNKTSTMKLSKKDVLSLKQKKLIISVHR